MLDIEFARGRIDQWVDEGREKVHLWRRFAGGKFGWDVNAKLKASRGVSAASYKDHAVPNYATQQGERHERAVATDTDEAGARSADYDQSTFNNIIIIFTCYHGANQRRAQRRRP